MAEVMWTSPALEFHQKHVGTPSPPAAANTPDLLMRWQPLLTGVDESRREELVGILEFETKLVMEIMGVTKWAEDFAVFLKTEKADWALRTEKADWVAEDPADKQHVLSYYHQAVKRKVLEKEGRYFTIPASPMSPPSSSGDQTQEIIALRLAHKTEVDAWKRACERAKSDVEALNRVIDAQKVAIDAERQKADDRHAKWVRAQADFDNYQKRVKRDQESERAASLRKILGDLVTVIDNAALVVENAAKPEATAATITMALTTGVHAELVAIMARHGGKPMGVKAGDLYDPIRHEAVSIVTEDGAVDRDEVLSVVREGYMIGTAILRAASVFVKRTKVPKPAATDAPAPAKEAM